MSIQQNAQDVSGGASVWLLPSEADTVLLRGVIAELSGRFGSPVFEPHLTLAGDLHSNWGAYVPVLDDLAKTCRTFSQPVEQIVLTEAYFRSFYAAFARSAELDALKRICVDRAGGAIDGFMPHVSLLYGKVPETEKREAAKRIEQMLRGRQVSFDRVVVTNSSDNVPINEWRIHATRTLKKAAS